MQEARITRRSRVSPWRLPRRRWRAGSGPARRVSDESYYDPERPCQCGIYVNGVISSVAKSAAGLARKPRVAARADVRGGSLCCPT